MHQSSPLHCRHLRGYDSLGTLLELLDSPGRLRFEEIFVRAFYARTQIGFEFPNCVIELGDIGQFSRRAIGFAGISFDFANEADGVRDEFGKVEDGDLVASPNVDTFEGILKLK